MENKNSARKYLLLGSANYCAASITELRQLLGTSFSTTFTTSTTYSDFTTYSIRDSCAVTPISDPLGR